MLCAVSELALGAAAVALSSACEIGGLINPSINNARVTDRITRFIVTSPVGVLHILQMLSAPLSGSPFRLSGQTQMLTYNTPLFYWHKYKTTHCHNL